MKLCDSMGLPRAPEVWAGEPSVEALAALLDRPSVEARRNGVELPGNVMEGVVVRSDPLLRTVFAEWLIVKHKIDRFAEVARRTAPRRPDRGPVEAFARTFVVRGRVLNAVGRIRDRGIELEGRMSDLRRVGPEVVEDLRRECTREWTALEEQGFAEKTLRGAVDVGPRAAVPADARRRGDVTGQPPTRSFARSG